MKEHRILVVDDDRLSASIAAELLRTVGNKVDIILDPEEVLSIDLTPYDLFIFDIFMPNIDGFDLLAFIRKDKALDLKPVIFVTGLDDPKHLVMGLKQGADDYIKKPYDGRELIARIEKALEMTRIHHTEQVITAVQETIKTKLSDPNKSLTDRERKVVMLVTEMDIALQHIKTITGEWEDLDYEVSSDLKLVEKCIDTLIKVIK